MKAQFRLIDADQPRQAFSRLRQHCDQSQGPQGAIRKLVTAETFVAVIDPIEANTAIHSHRIQLLDGRRNVTTMAVNALPGLLICDIIALLEAE